MKGGRISIIAKKAKIADQKHTVKLDVLKQKWSKAKPLKVINELPLIDKTKPLTKKQIKEIAKQERLAKQKEVEKSVFKVLLNKVQSFDECDLTYQQVKQRKRILDRLRKQGLI